MTYTATGFTDSNLEKDDHLAKGGAVTADNVGGVVELKPGSGSVKLKDDLEFVGTLVIDGDLYLDGENIRLTSITGFPAIVATGAVYISNTARSVVINGVVVANNGVRPSGSAQDSSTTINGGVLAERTGFGSTLGGSHLVVYSKTLSRLHDFSIAVNQRTPTVSVTGWND